MKLLLHFLLPAASVALLGGCRKQEVAAAPPQPTPEVKVITATVSAEVVTIEQPGRGHLLFAAASEERDRCGGKQEM